MCDEQKTMLTEPFKRLDNESELRKRLLAYCRLKDGEIWVDSLSLKTSLRERAGQTYKWKLLMEIATSDNAIREKYNISYNPKVVPIICFATTDFYDKINQPQFRGMLKFFDASFIADRIDSNFESRMSSLPGYVNDSL